jgi:hypothetical protein
MSHLAGMQGRTRHWSQVNRASERGEQRVGKEQSMTESEQNQDILRDTSAVV